MPINKHHHFGSTPNFNNLYRQVALPVAFAYMQDNPHLLSPHSKQVTADIMNNLIKWLPMPKLRFIGSEKLHGENCGICYTKGELWINGRNHVRTLLNDQNGMAAALESNKDKWLSIISQLVSKFDIDTSTHTIVIDCEWAGGNIQNGNAACSGTDKGTYIFDYFRVVNNDTSESHFKPTTGLKVYPEDSIYLMSSFSRHAIDLDFNNPIQCEADLKDLAETIEAKSAIANYFNKPDNVGEGAYLWCEYNGTMLRLKTKGEKHGGKPKQPRTPKETKSPEEVKRYEELATAVTPVWRITQAITETNATERKHLGEVIKWVIADVVKEETPKLLEANILIRDLSRYISAEVKDYYFNSLKDY